MKVERRIVMIRVVYRWKVKPGHEDVFVKAWVRGTKVIRTTVKGARGSLLLHSQKNPSEFLAIALWDSLDDWRTFRRGERPDLESFRAVAAVSKLQSVEPFSEVRDLRVFRASEMNRATAGSTNLATRSLERHEH